ncbi:hypothetical protein JCM24511_06511 [Saitozyma sp. JCM 24511]|nr:hypothetical protein JCM24511_06511 [Saitozyma sp. JCM 24511]
MSTADFSLSSLFSVSNKVVVITGGGTGIALAKAFAQNGAKVYITGRRVDVLNKTAEELQLATKGQVIAIEGDVSTKAGCEAIAQQIAKYETKVDVLVNCAGILLPENNIVLNVNDADKLEQTLWGVDDEHWRKTLDINVNGTYFMTIASLPLLRKSSGASVINIASGLGWPGFETRAFGAVAYNTSKAAVLHLTENLAARLATTKIRVNALAPGFFPSEMSEGKGNEGGGVHPAILKAGKRNPTGRIGLHEEIAGPALLLASKAGGFINGTAVLVDGGQALAGGINDGVRLPDELYTHSGI